MAAVAEDCVPAPHKGRSLERQHAMRIKHSICAGNLIGALSAFLARAGIDRHGNTTD